jgi:hypothetical protein
MSALLIRDRNLLSGIIIALIRVYFMDGGQEVEENIIPRPLTGVIQVVIR